MRTVEGTLVGDIVDKQNAHSATVIRRRDGPESFLASSVPLDMTREYLTAGRRGEGTHNLELDPLPVYLNGANLEVDADSGDEGRRPGVIAETEEQAGFADRCGQVELRLSMARKGMNTRVADEEELENDEHDDERVE